MGEAVWEGESGQNRGSTWPSFRWVMMCRREGEGGFREQELYLALIKVGMRLCTKKGREKVIFFPI